jgi:hypothetical protein
MDAEIEVLDGVLEGELVTSERGGLLERARGVVANPRVQGAAAATAGLMAGAATMALMRRAGVASALRNASPNPVGPSTVGWPAGPTIGPIAPGTYIVRVRAINLPPQQQ